MMYRTPLVLKEAMTNSTTRVGFESALGRQLLALPQGSTILMYNSDHVGALQDAGIPLRQTVNEGDYDSFHAARAALAELHDRLWEESGVGPERTVLGGFSMGSVMSYAMALGADRPAVAGVLAFSGFVPTVEGWQPSLADRQGTRAFIAHGRRDPIMDIEFARRARELLERGGLEVEYRETELGHQIDPAHIADATAWLGEALSA